MFAASGSLPAPLPGIRAALVLRLMTLALPGTGFYLQTRHPVLPVAGALASAAGIYIVKTGDNTMLILTLRGFMLAAALKSGVLPALKQSDVTPAGFFHTLFTKKD